LPTISRERSIVFERLERLGIHCLNVPSSGLAPAVINRYLAIKTARVDMTSTLGQQDAPVSARRARSRPELVLKSSQFRQGREAAGASSKA